MQTVGVAFTCWAIVSGISAWRKEFIGKRRIELAEEVLATFYEIKDAMSRIRSPYSEQTEGDTRKKNDNETQEEKELLNRAYIVFERYEKNCEPFRKFKIQKHRFMAAFGPETESIFHSTNDVLNEVFSAASRLGRYLWPRQGKANEMTQDQFKKHLSDMQKHQGVFWEKYDEDDVIQEKLSSIQERLREITRPAFEGK